MSTALIIGASRGIGHELASQYLKQGWRVIATARNIDDCSALTALGATALQLDVTSAINCSTLPSQLAGEQIDVAILNAGLYGPRVDAIPLQTDFDQVMHTNVLAAMRLLPVIAPMVCAARGKLAVISSIMASLSARNSTYGSLYRASKAALNSVLVDTALTFGPQGATCVAFHPGWVRTSMGGEGADLSPEQSAAGMRSTLAALAPSEHAAFLNYDGEPLGW
jgi:NAD(P)-dependent dehydrogenase (short-subunit alcohol dehydrogenase family)